MNNSKNKATALAEVLQSKSVALPVFIRFQTASEMQTVPVVSLSASKEGLTVQFSENQKCTSRSFDWSDLIDIIAFCDANRKSVSLHDFEAENGAYEEEIREEQQQAAGEATSLYAAVWDFAHGKKIRSCWWAEGFESSKCQMNQATSLTIVEVPKSVHCHINDRLAA